MCALCITCGHPTYFAAVSNTSQSIKDFLKWSMYICYSLIFSLTLLINLWCHSVIAIHRFSNKSPLLTPIVLIEPTRSHCPTKPKEAGIFKICFHFAHFICVCVLGSYLREGPVGLWHRCPLPEWQAVRAVSQIFFANRGGRGSNEDGASKHLTDCESMKRMITQ